MNVLIACVIGMVIGALCMWDWRCGQMREQERRMRSLEARVDAVLGSEEERERVLFVRDLPPWSRR